VSGGQSHGSSTRCEVCEAGSQQSIIPPTTERQLAFSTIAGKTYLVERQAKPADTYPILQLQGVRQTGPRLLAPVMLGMPREGWKRYFAPGPKSAK